MNTIPDPAQTDLADIIPPESMSQEQCLAELERLSDELKTFTRNPWDGSNPERFHAASRMSQRVFALTRRLHRLQIGQVGT